MLSYKIWNKKDSINGFDSSYWIKSFNLKENVGVFLILNNGVVERFEIDTIIKSNYNLDVNLSTDQVAQIYLRKKEEEKLQAEKEQASLEEQQEKISILEAENETLKQELSITQDAVNELIFNSLNM